ncbi:MAG: BON domain-containing protein [Cyclobacteriaceae bacterium]|nr:BON domain-containing protein [Cyclobacteriaceae bacterium]
MKTDYELQKDVMEEIKWDPSLRTVASEIGVSVKDGVVTLSGRVDQYSKKLAAEQAAQRVAGVRVVAEDIVVKLPGTLLRTDTEIAQAVSNALKWHASVNEDVIEVKVEDGWIYLDGTVEWEYQKRAAEIAIRDLIGVKGVLNRIHIKPSLDAHDIKSKIAATFHRSATIDSGNVKVDVNGSRVILKGKVRSWAERQEAEKAAWAAPGVVMVDNKIEVNPAILELA